MKIAFYCRVNGQGFCFVLPDEADKLREFFAEHQDISVPLILSIRVRRQLSSLCQQIKPCRGYGQSLHCANFVQPTSSGGSARHCGA